MSDYISRESVLEALVTWGANHDVEHTKELADRIQELPATPMLTPDVVRGKWISNGYSGATCDQCGNQCHEQFYQNFCPNCGADMREETSNDN